MSKLIKHSILLALLLAFYSLPAQLKRVQLAWLDQQPVELSLPAYFEVTDSLQALALLRDIQQDLYAQGYFLAEAELSKETDSLWLLQLKAGSLFYWGDIRLAASGMPASSPDLSREKLQGRKVQSESYQQLAEKFLQYWENRGYPFARFGFSAYHIKGDTISGTVTLDPGPIQRIDSIAIKGYAGFPEILLRHELGLEKGMIYNERQIRELSEKVAGLEYLSFQRPPALAFSRQKNILFLYFNKVESNEIDGIIGLNTSQAGEVSFNGNFNLRLLNALKRGEEIFLNWQRPDDNISNLQLSLAYPYLFKSPFVLAGKMEIFRQDSSFINAQFGGNLKYILGNANFLVAGLTYRSSNVLLDNEENANIQAFSTTTYSLGFERWATDRRIVPRRGNILNASVYSGQRNVESGRSQQYGWNIYNAQYWNLWKYHVIKTSLHSEIIIGDNLLDNELYRLGGLRSLRGFNERSIYASSYAIGSLEYRYMLGDYDYLTLFSDAAYTRRENDQVKPDNWFLGLGGGLNIRTNGGIFSLFYALGRSDQSAFDIKTSKIHFGYINRF